MWGTIARVVAYCCVPAKGDAVLDMVDEALASSVVLIYVILEEVDVWDATVMVG